MKKLCGALLGNSFYSNGRVVGNGKIALPVKIIQVMGDKLKGEILCGTGMYILVTKIGDEYFTGESLTVQDNIMLLPSSMYKELQFNKGDPLELYYNGDVDYFTIKKRVNEL